VRTGDGTLTPMPALHPSFEGWHADSRWDSDTHTGDPPVGRWVACGPALGLRHRCRRCTPRLGGTVRARVGKATRTPVVRRASGKHGHPSVAVLAVVERAASTVTSGAQYLRSSSEWQARSPVGRSTCGRRSKGKYCHQWGAVLAVVERVASTVTRRSQYLRTLLP
jgi:hypothetical protein